MFSIAKETIEIHRQMDKLSKVKQFLSSKARGTVYHNHNYKTSLAYLSKFINEKYSSLTLDTIIDSISHKKIDVYRFLDEYVAFLHTKKLSQASRNQYLTGVKSYLQFHDVDIVSHKFKMRVTVPKIPREDELPIDQNDIRTILLQCHNRRLKTFLLVLASSGVRAIEACALRFSDIYFDENPTRIHIRAKYTKTKLPRDVYISDETSYYLKEWVEHRLGVTLDKTSKFNKRSDELVFQVFNTDYRKVEPKTIYNKLIQQFQTLLDEVGFGQRKDGMARRQITFHSFRRFVKTSLSDSPAGRDYSEWFLGHIKSSYYVKKPEARALIYKEHCMRYLTFLDYSTLKATGKTIESKVNEIKKEKEIMSQKHEQEMEVMREQIATMGSQLQLLVTTMASSDPAVRNKLAKQLVKNGIFKPDPPN